MAARHKDNGDFVLSDQVQTAAIPFVEILLRGVEDRRCGIFGEGLKFRLGRLRLGWVQGSVGDLIDVIGVEVA